MHQLANVIYSTCSSAIIHSMRFGERQRFQKNRLGPPGAGGRQQYQHQFEPFNFAPEAFVFCSRFNCFYISKPKPAPRDMHAVRHLRGYNRFQTFWNLRLGTLSERVLRLHTIESSPSLSPLLQGVPLLFCNLMVMALNAPQPSSVLLKIENARFLMCLMLLWQ